MAVINSTTLLLLPIAIGLLISPSPSDCIRNAFPEDDRSAAPEFVLNAKASGEDTNHSGGRYVEANCSHLIIRGGLQNGESVKVTFNGWRGEDKDMIVTLVSDSSSSASLALSREDGGVEEERLGMKHVSGEEDIKLLETGIALAEDADVDFDINGEGDTHIDLDSDGDMEIGGDTDIGSDRDTGSDTVIGGDIDIGIGTDIGTDMLGGRGEGKKGKTRENLKEEAILPWIGVRIRGRNRLEQEGNTTPNVAVLLYRDGPDSPTEVPLDSPAAFNTPVMILFTKVSLTEMRVAVFTWVSEPSENGVAAGRWLQSSVVVGSGMYQNDLRVNVNDANPNYLHLYASSSADILTYKDESACSNLPSSPLVRIIPQPPVEWIQSITEHLNESAGKLAESRDNEA